MPNSPVIVGIDEAGRGALAGPVVAGACVLSSDIETHPLIADSKQLEPEVREQAFSWIQSNAIYGYGVVEAHEIDTIGILGATEKAMNMALSMVEDSIKPTYLLVDGRDKFWFNYPHSSVIKGDEKEPCISAASIIAKVYRDRLMIQHAATFPEYGFNLHKGYGTEEHFAAIDRSGTTLLHRQCFLTKHFASSDSTK